MTHPTVEQNPLQNALQKKVSSFNARESSPNKTAEQ